MQIKLQLSSDINWTSIWEICNNETHSLALRSWTDYETMGPWAWTCQRPPLLEKLFCACKTRTHKPHYAYIYILFLTLGSNQILWLFYWESRQVKVYSVTSTFVEVCTALLLFLTLHCDRATAFSKLKLIKTYLRGSLGQERLNGLATLSIEKENHDHESSPLLCLKGVVQLFGLDVQILRLNQLYHIVSSHDQIKT